MTRGLLKVVICTGEKNFICSLCNKEFSFHSNLTSNKRSHSGEKLLKYNLCDKRFSQYSHLPSHKTSYTGKTVQI